jgi:hypothetical protein
MIGRKACVYPLSNADSIQVSSIVGSATSRRMNLGESPYVGLPSIPSVENSLTLCFQNSPAFCHRPACTPHLSFSTDTSTSHFDGMEGERDGVGGMLGGHGGKHERGSEVGKCVRGIA